MELLSASGSYAFGSKQNSHQLVSQKVITFQFDLSTVFDSEISRFLVHPCSQDTFCVSGKVLLSLLLLKLAFS